MAKYKNKKIILLEKREDWEEIQNCIKTTNYGVNRVKGKFLVYNRLIREIVMKEIEENIKHYKNL